MSDISNQDFSGAASGGGISGSAIAGGIGGLFGAAGSLISGNANAAGDTAAATGYTEEANLYNEAAQQSGMDIGLVQAGGAVQVAQLKAQIEKTEATGLADEGQGNVNTNTGSPVNIIANSQRQGALAIGQQNLQTNIEAQNFELMQTGYEAQSAGATGAAAAATAAASASSSGGILGALGSVASIAMKFLPF
ncbi:MAG TPA: hypothetical protein VNU19_07095 [Candidatus Acidoferrum sp.]|jgi:hypothetical protein|nr:hypothetical protein [Candidatus Acidoferrum sp.]